MKTVKKLVNLLLALVLIAAPILGAAPALAYTQDNLIVMDFESIDGPVMGGTSPQISSQKKQDNEKPIYTLPDGYEFSNQRVDVTYYYKVVEKTEGSVPLETHKPYIKGAGDNEVNPDGSMTRAEIATIIYRLDGEPTFNTSAVFPDVQSGAWYYNAVMYLQGTGVVEGYDNGNFGPSDHITRAQMATILARYKKLDITKPGNSQFSDVPAGQWYSNAVSVLADKGWITGYPGGTFGPSDKITRAQAMTMINRMLGRSLSNADVPTSVTNPYSDISPSHWAYGEVLEASVSHDSSWHGAVDPELPSVTPTYKVTEQIIDKAGDKVIDTIVTEFPHDVIPAHAEFSNDKLYYIFAGYEATIQTVVQKSGAGFDTYHGAVGWDTFGAYRNSSENMGLGSGYVTTGDYIEYHVGIENNTAIAKEDFYYKASFEQHGILPNAAALNARMEIKLDDYYDFNANFASQKPENYVGKRIKLVSVEGELRDYDYDAENAIVTVYWGDIPLGDKRELTITCEILPMPGVSESTLKLTPKYYTDNIAMPSLYLTPTISVGVPPKGNPYIKQYDDYGLGEGYAQYSFKVLD